MKKYASLEERIYIYDFLMSGKNENILFGLDLLQSSPRYKYFRKKIIYRMRASYRRKGRVLYKQTVEQLINHTRRYLQRSYMYSITVYLLAKALIKYEKLF